MIGYIALILVYMLPVSTMKAHVRDDIALFEKEGSYPQLVEGYKSTQLDNFTDIIMIMNAIYDGDESAIHKAIAVYRYNDEEKNDISELTEYLNNDSRSEKWSYTWYPHGYLIILKPLLLIMRYSDIRILSSALTMFVIILTTAGLYKRKIQDLIIPYLAAVIVINPSVVSLSLQYASAWYMMHALFLWLIYFWDCEKNDHIEEFFLAAGIGIAYFDFLTYPLVVYAIPALTALYLLQKKNSTSLTYSLKKTISTGASFVIGYIWMFLTKWILGAIAVGDNVWNNVHEHVSERMSGSGIDSDIHRTDAITRNVATLATPPILLFFGALTLAVIIYLLLKKTNKKHCINNTVLGITFMMMPLVWFFVFANHSHAHYFFTFRILAVTVFAFYTVLIAPSRTSLQP